MKKLIMVIMFLVLSISVVSVNAGCERYWDELTDQSFTITVDETEFMVYFNDSCYGPCPGGKATLKYIDTQEIDGILYEAEITINLGYSTTVDYVIVEGLSFILSDGKLILLPEEPWIFKQIVDQELQE